MIWHRGPWHCAVAVQTLCSGLTIGRVIAWGSRKQPPLLLSTRGLPCYGPAYPSDLGEATYSIHGRRSSVKPNLVSGLRT